MNHNRLKTISWAIILVIFIITARFFYWQAIKPKSLSPLSLTQSYKIENIASLRGRIYSSDRSPLVLNQTSFRLSIYKPNLEESIDQIISKIDQVYPNFSQENISQISYFKQDAIKWYTFPSAFSPAMYQQLNGIAGLSFSSSSTRTYPEFDLGSTLLGTYNPDDNQGLFGLEKYYDKQLKGKNGFFRLSQDALGQSLLLDSHWLNPSQNGLDLHLHLNRYLQLVTQDILKQGIDQFQADSGTITILNSKTGGVLAMVSLTASTSATTSASLNPIIANLFEPGSIFKPLVIASALDSQSINSDYICPKCDTPITIGQNTISNWNDQVHPQSTLKDIITNSDNIGMTNIIQTMGLENFLKYFNLLDLNQKTGIDLSGEVKPPVKKTWSQIDLAASSFGQGIALSQIQMIKAFNSLANQGTMINPTLGKFLKLGDSIKTITPITKPVFKPATATLVTSILEYATSNGAVASIKPKGLSVCAKSGTAQIAIGGQYSLNNTIASYIGFSPCINPKFTMIVTIDNPKTSPWGSSTAAPIWFKLAQIISILPTDSL